MTRTATASSWARARASSCSKNSNMPGRAARKSTARSKATGFRATPITSPPPPRTATAASCAMQMAFKRAGLSPSDIGYVNSHGTSTMADGIELGAVERLFGNAAPGLAMSSTKSSIGHLLGAAGAGREAIFASLRYATGSCRQRSISKIPMSRPKSTWRRLKAQKARGERRPVQQFRLWAAPTRLLILYRKSNDVRALALFWSRSRIIVAGHRQNGTTRHGGCLGPPARAAARPLVYASCRADRRSRDLAGQLEDAGVLRHALVCSSSTCAHEASPRASRRANMLIPGACLDGRHRGRRSSSPASRSSTSLTIRRGLHERR